VFVGPAHHAFVEDRFAVVILTARRPDLARYAVLQWSPQSREPEQIFVLQLDDAPNYGWCAEDLSDFNAVTWFRSPQEFRQSLETAAPDFEWLVVSDLRHAISIDQLHDLSMQSTSSVPDRDFYVQVSTTAQGDAELIEDPVFFSDLSRGIRVLRPGSASSSAAKVKDGALGDRSAISLLMGGA
jgi:hypothetical protein